MFKEPTPSYTVFFDNLPDAVQFKPMLNNMESVRRGLSASYPLSGIPNGWRLLPLGEGLANRKVVNVLELYQLEGIDAIDADNAISLNISKNLFSSGNSTVIAVGCDQETGVFYPIGASDLDGNILIDDLPVSTTGTVRSLGGSSKIFFFQANFKESPYYIYNYPQLAIAQLTESTPDKFSIQYELDAGQINKAINQADKIIILIHGLLSTTQNMFSSIQNSDYDLILTFDYENMDTSISDTANDFSNRLKDVGIVSGTDKKIDIIAYGMGGLVARWFVEKLEGNQVSNHLYLVGTPNQGIAYESFYEITTSLSSTLFSRPIEEYGEDQSILWMMRRKDKMFITLKQLHAESDFLKALNDGTDPQIPYTIIAGNTQLQREGIQTDKYNRLLKKVMAKFKSRGHYDAIDMLLFKAPNDLLASTKSIKTIPGAESRQFPPRIIECSCDHLGYFTSEEGKRALRSALPEE